MRLQSADVNGDGRDDLVVANSAGPNHVRLFIADSPTATDLAFRSGQEFGAQLRPADIALRDVIDHALATGERKLVLDFEELQSLDSSGLGELLSAAGRIAAFDGWLAWANCPRTMMDLLDITHVDVSGVEFHDSVDAAAAAGQAAS